MGLIPVYQSTKTCPRKTHGRWQSIGNSAAWRRFRTALAIAPVLLACATAAAMPSMEPASPPTTAVPPAQTSAAATDTFAGLVDVLSGHAQIARTIVYHPQLPLSPIEKQALEAELQAILGLCSNILANVTIGEVDVTVAPLSLRDYGNECLLLAQTAQLELKSGADCDYALVYSKIKTIEYLILRTSPGNYRTEAGIN